MNIKKEIWIFTFEYAGIAKIGGLGEVPANQAKFLSTDFNISVFIPSHGRIKELQSKAHFSNISFKSEGKLRGSIFSDDNLEHEYSISFYEMQVNEVNVVLLSGNNEFTRFYLDDQIVYNPDTIKGKILLFNIGMRDYFSFLLESESSKLPSLIHVHDYHPIISIIGIKQLLHSNNLAIPTIITIHLLTYPRFDLTFYKACKIDDEPFIVNLNSNSLEINFNRLIQLAQDTIQGDQVKELPTVEKIGAMISDLVTTVSKSYLYSDVIPNCGGEMIRFKADFIWDGCDWDYEQIFQESLQTHRKGILEFLNKAEDEDISIEDMKKYLLEYKIGKLSHPLIDSQKILNAINEISNGNPFIKNGTIKPFDKYGPLILTTGRISPQKGFETILESIPSVISAIPEIKFLFLILPTEYSIGEIKKYADYVKLYPDNLRIIFGVAPDIYYLAHITSDVYCAVSRWEPFGIMALEAMASKVPVIATRVGGLQETVIDIRINKDNGTGILINKDDKIEFSEALISLTRAAQIATLASKGKENEINFENIPDKLIRSILTSDLIYYFKIKENCYRRVKNYFTWEVVTEKLRRIYHQLT
jgi:glycogen synthase